MKTNPFRTALALLTVATFLGGCSTMPLLDPKGPVGTSELVLIIISFALMLLVVIPVIILSIWFPRRYNAAKPKGDYSPKWSYSLKIEFIVWAVPAVIVVALSILTWKDSHRLDPYNAIDSPVKPINIEAVSFDWKWLFIYPDQHVATINHLVVPVNVPLNFKITSDTVMTAFFIPQLGSQIYAMGGMQTRLNLLADEPGIYTGQNQQYSGDGFPDMHFDVKATSREQFDNWIAKTQQAPDKLDLAQVEKIRQPGVGFAIRRFSSVTPGLFNTILNKYRKPPVNQTAGDRRVHIAKMEEK